MTKDNEIHYLTVSRDDARTELARLKSERDELRESVALARVIIERIGTTDANSSDNIRRAEAWMKRTEGKP